MLNFLMRNYYSTFPN